MVENPFFPSGKGLKQSELLKQQAAKRGGILHKRKMPFATPYISFIYHGMSIEVEYQKNREYDSLLGDSITKVKTKFSKSIVKKFVVCYRDMIFSEMQGGIIGIKEIKNNRAFEEKLLVKCTDENFASDILTADIQRRLIELSEQNYYPIIKIIGDNFSLIIPYNRLESEDEYDLLINTAFMFLDRLRLLGYI